jgi:molybdopterin converting factor small subunit
MKITTNIFGPEITLKEDLSLDTSSAALGEVVKAILSKREGALKSIVKDDLSLETGCVILVNGRNILSLENLDTRIHDGDEITFTVLLAGG